MTYIQRVCAINIYTVNTRRLLLSTYLLFDVYYGGAQPSPSIAPGVPLIQGFDLS
jgi:hypothetical protein